MNVDQLRGPYMVVTDTGRLPFFAGVQTRDGGRLCHWTFLRRLYEHSGRELEFSREAKVSLKQLAAQRKWIIEQKLSENGAELFGPLFRPEKQPYDYQIQAMRFLCASKGSILADDVGLGKTIMSIGVILRGFSTGEIRKVIILCPSSVKFQWRDEFEKFGNPAVFPDLMEAIQVVDGSAKRRRAIWGDRDADIWITTYQSFMRDRKAVDGLGLDPKKLCVIADEVNAIKNRTTKTAKAVKSLISEYRLGLTATPIENRLHDLYSIAEWVDPAIFPGYSWFEKEYCNTVMIPIRHGNRQIRIPKVISYRNLGDAKGRMEHAYLRRTALDVSAQMPEVAISTLRLEMPKAQRLVYEKVRQRAYSEDERMNLMGEIVRLREICDSSGLVEGEHISAKADELVRMAEEMPESEKVVVFSEFRKMTDYLAKRLKKWRPLYIHGGTSGIERQMARISFEETDTRFMLLTAAGERGLNLQVAGVLVNIDLPYNPARLKQRIGRIWRIGSGHSRVRVINMVMEDTFEQRVLGILNRKADLFDAMFKPDGLDLIGDPVEELGVAALKRLC